MKFLSSIIFLFAILIFNPLETGFANHESINRYPTKYKYSTKNGTKPLKTAKVNYNFKPLSKSNIERNVPKRDFRRGINMLTVKESLSYTVLVNKHNTLPQNFLPPDLLIPNVTFSFMEDSPKKYLRAQPAKALERMFAAAEKDNIKLIAVSGYRSYQRQKEIFEYKSRLKGEIEANRLSARPGESEHQTGLAIDISCKRISCQLIKLFERTPEGIWLKNNAAKFGFIIRYPKGKEDLTGYKYEPWHLRYVTPRHARKIASNNLILEEYIKK